MKKTRDILRLFNIRPRKRFGQNFLVSEEILDRIIETADIKKSDLVIEIGPGVGNLTQRICDHAGYTAAVEIDRDMQPVLEFVLGTYHNWSVLYKDILEIDIESEIIGRFKTDEMDEVKLIANLPYYISTAIITKLLSCRTAFSRMVIMVQKEVAERICADPGSKRYGVLSVAVQLYAEAAIAFDIPAGDFIPAPKVDSSLVVIDRYAEDPFKIEDEDFFFSVVKAAFSQRRKTMANSLHAAFGKKLSKAGIQKIIKEIGEHEDVRAEKVSVERFCELTEKLRQTFNSDR